MRHRLGITITVAMVAFGAFQYFNKKARSSVSFSQLKLWSAVSDQPERPACWGRRKCLVIFVAPWCPFCHDSNPAIRQLLKDHGTSSDKAVMVVTYSDELDKLKAHAKEYGAGAYYDPGGEFAIAARVTSLPT